MSAFSINNTGVLNRKAIQTAQDKHWNSIELILHILWLQSLS